ncbi:MAG: TraR/DksA C4-type zinc finger protein [Actinobacteria bacterium]|nr:TraR/DksA C4-type zinc finger protein [Actinomycetota bacterium]
MAPAASSRAKKAPTAKAVPAKKAPPAKDGPVTTRAAKTTADRTTAGKAPAGKTTAAKAAPAKQAAVAPKAAAKAAGNAALAKQAAVAPKAAAKAAPAKPAAKVARKSPFPAKWLEQQHQALIEERATYLRQSETLRAEADALVADFEPGDVQFDEESGEGDTLNIERERDLALSAQARQAVDDIDHALAKFAEGTYGICEVSGEPIPKERLEAIPWARERVEFKAGGLGRRG